MIWSMTGFGHGESEKNQKKIVVDIRSVNGKFLEQNIKMPRTFLPLEDTIRKSVSRHISRGNVDVFVNFFDSSASETKVVINACLANKIFEESKRLSDEFFVPNDMTGKDLLKFPDVLSLEKNEVDIKEIENILLLALEEALQNFDIMREREGAELKKDLLGSLSYIEQNMKKIKEIAPSVTSDYAQKLRLRIDELLGNSKIDDSKFANEVAFFADKSDINEEIVRMFSHIKQFNEITFSSTPSGKQFEFLIQEFTRETNTIGSKANSIELTNLVLFQKNEIEKMKEQIRNVE